ncbi:MAG: ABC transporter permease [Acetobacteraceae bacterium]|nr:ABC transporter permease [Acetobacteraceae bacterium]
MTEHPSALRPPSLLDGAGVQARVVGALILRELKTRFGRSRIGYLWAVIQPALVIAAIAVIFTVIGGDLRRGLPTASFLATGFIPFKLFMSVLERARGAVEGNRGLLLHPRITTLDIIVARTLLEGATFLVVLAVLGGGIVAFAFDEPPVSPLGLVADLGLAMLLGFGVGLAVGAAAIVVSSVERVVSVINNLLFFLSGVFYLPESLPSEIRDPLLLNPILHITEFARLSWYGA